MEQMMTEQNFIRAEILLGRNKPDNRMARYISQNADKCGKSLFNEVVSGKFHWSKPREKTILDSYKCKERRLKIPCLKDQAVQLAWLNIATPYIERRNYYYNCGSIPGAGQTRCVKALKKWLRNKRNKYAATTDIKKFYDTCPHLVIRKGLERIFKDRAFVDFAMGFVASMSDTGIGIAIGYPSSHWLANVALMEMDHEIKRKYPDVKYTRYMDDCGFVASNKRHLRKAVAFIRQAVEMMGMKLKKWQCFKVKDRGITFLSYRFFNGYTVLAKRLMYRIAKRMKSAGTLMNVHIAQGIVSYFGILKHCDSYNFRQSRCYPYVSKRFCTNLISDYSRVHHEKCYCC